MRFAILFVFTSFLTPPATAALSAAAESSDGAFQESAEKISKKARALSAEFNRKNAVRVLASSGKRFSTRCILDDYYARGYVTNHSRDLDLHIDGRVYFFFYDEDGREIGDARERAHERIRRRGTEEVEKHYYPDDTKTCAFDVSESVRWEDEEEDEEGARYSASCVIRNGWAYGYVLNRGPGSLRVSGRVTWYFYDDRGKEIDDERDRVSERVSRGDNELVGTTVAPARAETCSLDVSEAVEE